MEKILIFAVSKKIKNERKTNTKLWYGAFRGNTN